MCSSDTPYFSTMLSAYRILPSTSGFGEGNQSSCVKNQIVAGQARPLPYDCPLKCPHQFGGSKIYPSNTLETTPASMFNRHSQGSTSTFKSTCMIRSCGMRFRSPVRFASIISSFGNCRRYSRGYIQLYHCYPNRDRLQH